MADHVHVVGAFEAKTHLSDLLRRAENGEEFIIQRRGTPVARIVPYRPDDEPDSLATVVSRMRDLRDSVDGPVSVREWVDEGRRE